MSRTAKRFRAIGITVLAVAATNFAISFASGVPTIPDSPKPKASGVPTIPDSPKPKGSGVPTIPDSPKPKTSGVPTIPDSPKP
jgi:hypothetical protein